MVDRNSALLWSYERAVFPPSQYVPPVPYYRMRGIDTQCPPSQQPAYVYWTVANSPDYTAAQLSPSALPCGSDPLTDVSDIQIEAQWEEV